jgi:hypothetical protein
MIDKYLSVLTLTAAIVGSFMAIAPAFAGSTGNTINNVDVYNGMGSGGQPVTRVRNSRGRINNPSGANVHNDIQIGVSDTCGNSKNTNNTEYSGSTGASVSVNVDVCNPIYNNSTTNGR